MQNVVVTGTNGKLSCKTANLLKSKSGFTIRQLSIRGSMWEKEDFFDVDCIVHIAGVTPQNAKTKEDYEKINFLLTKKLADKALLCSVKQFIYISSMAVYGKLPSIKPENGRVDKTTPCLPLDEYGKSKLKAEKYLESLQSESFRVCIIRVPSIFDEEKTEYIDQYKYLADKFPIIPKAFIQNYKSFIHSDNLCELIHLAIKCNYSGIICPDEGKYSAFDICSAIYPRKAKLKALGKIVEIFMKKNARISDYYGAIYYNDDLTNIFDGEYRITNAYDAIGKLYER